jgi:hypothetical protein
MRSCCDYELRNRLNICLKTEENQETCVETTGRRIYEFSSDPKENTLSLKIAIF